MMESLHLVPVTMEGQAERAAAEIVPPPVLQSLAAHYAPGEMAEVLRALDSVHRKRTARAAFREARRQGQNAEAAIEAAAEAAGRKDRWARGVIYGG